MGFPIIPILLKKILLPIVVRKVIEKATTNKKKEPEMREMLMGFIRHALTTAGGAMAAKGYIGAGDVEMVVGAAVTLLGVAWSVVEKRRR